MDENTICIIFELVRRSYEELEILKCRNHELELENKRLYIELKLREAETSPQPPNSVVSSLDQVYVYYQKDDEKVATHIIWFTEAD